MNRPMRLTDFDNGSWSRGKSALFELAWVVLSALFVSSWIPGSTHRKWLLNAFGAKVGRDVVIKPGVKIKFPWRLSIGDYSWIGEDAWIDNLSMVTIGSNVCISQGAYLCTGSHDWSSQAFDLITTPISVGEGAWVSAKAVVGPGVTIDEGEVLCLGSVVTKDLAPWAIYSGDPGKRIKTRVIF